jgi:hypothetical protein
MSTVDQWLKEQEDHAVACALYGDCIYDVVQEGAKNLETRWAAVSRKWEALVDKAVKTGFMGWGPPLVDRRWLIQALFYPKLWPRGLTTEEKNLLHLMIAAASYHRLYARGVTREEMEPEAVEADDRTLAALKKLAELFKSQIAIPMWKEYQTVSEDYARKIQPMCNEQYDEPCTLSDAQNIFKGDLRRGWKARTLDVDPPTYRVMGPFLNYITG